MGYGLCLEKKVDVIDCRALQIHCYDPGYTLVEKLQAIVTKYRQHQHSGDTFPANFMRHYYDVFCLLQNSGVQAFIGTDQYNTHKNRRFPAIDRQKPLIENEALVLGDVHTRVLYQKEYERRAALYYQGQPPFVKCLPLFKRTWCGYKENSMADDRAIGESMKQQTPARVPPCR